jgi:hypothetical protein
MTLHSAEIHPLERKALELREKAILRVTKPTGRLLLKGRLLINPFVSIPEKYIPAPYIPRSISTQQNQEPTTKSDRNSHFVVCRGSLAPAPWITIIAHVDNTSNLPFEQIHYDMRGDSPSVNFHTISEVNGYPIMQKVLKPYGEDANQILASLEETLS